MLTMMLNSDYLQHSLVNSSRTSAPTYISAIASNINNNSYNVVHFSTALTAQNENTNIEMQYKQLKETILKLKITDHQYNDSLAQNIETAQLILDSLYENKMPLPEVCVAEDGEIEFDWVNENKEAIITISRKNRYSYLLKQPSGKYLSSAENISAEKILASNFVKYLNAEKI